MEEKRPDEAGAYEWDSALKSEPTPDEYLNPPGLGTDGCEVADDTSEDEPCEPSQMEDMVLGETMPGQGIPGFDAEEDGGA